MCELHGLLQDPSSYQPDTFDLFKNDQAAAYWFPCFRSMIEKFASQAASSQLSEDSSAVERAEQFRQAYLGKLEEYQRKIRQNEKNNSLGIRELLELNEIQLRQFGFADPWKNQKHSENSAALESFGKRLKEVDSIQNIHTRWTELVRGVLAGNMFDWGAQAVTNIIESESNFGLHSALERIEKRPWLMDDLDEWLKRMQATTVHKCALIFVDNSGVDVILGMLPFARELLKRGTKVLLCANDSPSLNDVTRAELTDLLKTCCCQCSVLAEAWTSEKLLVYGNGQRGPCLDMRTLPQELCEAIQTHETDLLIIEGMGRALHTNLYAKFSCETLKLAVVKNKWLAQHLGGDTFAVICKYEYR